MAAAASLETAMALHRSGDLAGAEEHYRHALRAAPSSGAAHFHLGRLLQARGKTFDAVDAYRDALELAPESPELYVGLGTALCELGELDGANACFQTALVLSPNFTPALFHLGNLCVVQCVTTTRLNAFSECLRIIHGSPTPIAIWERL